MWRHVMSREDAAVIWELEEAEANWTQQLAS